MSLELKKLQAELQRVIAARFEQEYLIAQRQDEIERLKKHVEVQLSKEQELTEQIQKLK